MKPVEFITEPDCLGLGRVIIGGRYYGLPIAQCAEYKTLRESVMDAYEQTDATANCCELDLLR